MRAFLPLLLLACIAPAGAAQRLDDFGYAAPIETGPGEALQRVEIPQGVYEGSVQPHLADLRVFNAHGEMVPFAFIPQQAPGEARAAAVALRYFPLHGARDASSVRDLDIVAERTADGTLVRVRSVRDGGRSRPRLLAYLVDASRHKVALQTLELDWKPVASGFSGSLRVEGSNDLARWSTLVAAAPLVSLEFGGERLEQKSVELPGARYRYLRLSWPPAQPALELTALAGRPAPAEVEPERRWKALPVVAGAKPGEYLLDPGGRLPIDRLRIHLPEPNTLVAVRVLARDRDQDAWSSAARAVVYRLTRNGTEATSPPIAIGERARYWKLEVDQAGGGIGAGMPAVQAGWVPQQIVFVARGAPPFELAYGNAGVQAAAYPIQTVVPGWRPDEPLKAALARVGAQREVAGPAALRARADYKTWLLWAALGLGVAILAWMAWQLTRQMNRGAGS
jgi:hypothetical protein